MNSLCQIDISSRRRFKLLEYERAKTISSFKVNRRRYRQLLAMNEQISVFSLVMIRAHLMFSSK